MSSPRIRSRWLPLLCIALAGCTVSGAPANTGQPGGRLKVEIENMEFEDMRVHIIANGSRLFLGTVPGLTTRSFVLPHAFANLSQVGITAVPLAGSEAIRSPVVPTGGGHTISWRLQRSSFGQAIIVR